MDPDDPNEEQIKKATESIILNDITEPVIEEKYDNTDIISESIKTGSDDATTKLNNMMNELNKPTIEMPSTTMPSKDIKPVTTDINIKPKLNTSVIKVDEPKTPTIIKLDEVKVNEVKVNEVKPDEVKPDEVKPDEVKPDEVKPDEVKPDEVKPDEVKPFSFSNLYPSISGQGKVEDITKDENKKDENKKDEVKDLNASIMKEVIGLDKKVDDIDETITLDNFFNDVQKMTNPMTPIKEEIKYTLFEDATEKE